jgi:[NiFe] hydrogenase diaphorase moiety small subunit
MVPRFPYLWPVSRVDASSPGIYHDGNRCVLCLRCVRGVKTADGLSVFGLLNRGDRTIVSIDREQSAKLSDGEARKAMDMCPVGAILKKEIGYAVPIGKRRFDAAPIGDEAK